MNEYDVKSVSKEIEKRRITWNIIIKHATLSAYDFSFLLLDTNNEWRNHNFSSNQAIESFVIANDRKYSFLFMIVQIFNFCIHNWT